jgi:2-polyprenyl-6-methoxyphenol hydroxylase-like FAD-dependent oxidoreductase
MGEYAHRSVMSGGLMSRQELPSVNDFRGQIKANNDGSMPREPWQRSMQIALEAQLKDLASRDGNINDMWGIKFESLEENDNGVVSTCTNVDTGAQIIIQSQYVVGCDGASSKVRASIGAQINGGQL